MVSDRIPLASPHFMRMGGGDQVLGRRPHDNPLALRRPFVEARERLRVPALADPGPGRDPVHRHSQDVPSDAPAGQERDARLPGSACQCSTGAA